MNLTVSKIESLETRTYKISKKSTWIFVLIKTRDFIGLGEATLYGQEDEVIKSCHDLAQRIDREGLQQFEKGAFDRADQTLSPTSATALSAIEQAIYDVSSQEIGVPLRQLLDVPGSISGTSYYANINRSVTIRTPAGWVNAASSAAKMGFTYIKVAPFDGVNLHTHASTDIDIDSSIDHGLKCIRAIHDRFGNRLRLMIDCHAHFNLQSALRMLERVSEIRPYWIEEPLQEIEDNIADIRRFRKEANNRGILVAGL